MSALFGRPGGLYKAGFGSVRVYMTFIPRTLFLVPLSPPLLHCQCDCLSVLLRHPLFGLTAGLRAGHFGYYRLVLARSASALNPNTTALPGF